MNVMQPKKRPTWANEAFTNPPPVNESSSQPESKPQGEPTDLEWMRQRISKQVDQDEKVFEQSDDDEPIEDPGPVSFSVSSRYYPNFVF